MSFELQDLNGGFPQIRLGTMNDLDSRSPTSMWRQEEQPPAEDVYDSFFAWNKVEAIAPEPDPRIELNDDDAPWKQKKLSEFFGKEQNGGR